MPRATAGLGLAAAMHRWDSRLRPPPAGIAPTAWGASPRRRDATHADEVPTQGQLRGRTWRRSSRGRYVPVEVAQTPEQRIVEAAELLPGYGAVGGWAAAYWAGVRLLDGGGRSGRTAEPVLLCVGADRKLRRRENAHISRDRLPDSDVEMVRGVRTTTPLRTAFDGARLADNLQEAVVFLDMMATAGQVELTRISAYVEDHPGWRGVKQARRACSLAVRGSRSPPETRMRLVWVLDAGLPSPIVNQPAFGQDGRFLGIPDCLECDSGTVLEYDGDEHRDLVNHTADNIREKLLEEHGLAALRVTRLDLNGTRARLVDRMVRTHARRLLRDRSLDRWMLTPPPGWRPL